MAAASPANPPSVTTGKRVVGTAMLDVTFDSLGRAVEATIEKSSGRSDLDAATRDFILNHWRNMHYAGMTVRVPIEFNLGK
jgi:TonB family protein